MYLPLICYFRLLYEAGSPEAAARLAGTTVRTVREKLRELQDVVRAPLFLCQNGAYQLTDAGRELLSLADTMEGTLRDFCASLRQEADSAPSICLSVNACTSLLEQIFIGFKEKYPNIDLQITQHADDGQTDFRIVTEAEPPDDACALLLMKEPLCLLLNRSHRLAARSSVQLKELAQESFVLQKRGNPLRKIVARRCRQAGFSPKIIIETDNTLTYRRAAEANQSVSIVPSITSCSITGGRCTTREIVEPGIYRCLVLRWNDSGGTGEPFLAVRNYLVEFFRSLPRHRDQIFIQTFGRFEIYARNQPVYFSSKKSKELLALLVDRQGGIVTMEQAVDCLWENAPYDERVKRRYRSAVIALRNTLKKYDIEHIVCFQRAGAFIVREAVSCDLFDLLRSPRDAARTFSGEYMLDYSWGERTLPLLSSLRHPQH